MIAPIETADPHALFDAWFAQAVASEPNDPNAMTLATATPDGMPSARIVLLKGHDPEGHPARGFVFYSNRTSRKGGELAANRHAALLFHWKSLRRQVRIEGRVSDVSDTEADAYYATRPRLSRLGAWASEQSRPLEARETLLARLAEQEQRFPDEAIPRPPFWSGFRVTPARFEFWQEADFRLHDRNTFAATPDGGWKLGKLYP